MKLILLFLILCLSLFSCDKTEPKKKEPNQQKLTKKLADEQPKKQIFKVEEIGDSSLIFGEWKIVDIAGKAVPDDRKEITATFKPDGAFERRLSPAHKPDIGTWSIETVESVKILKLYTAAGKEDNQLIKLTKEELIFINFRKPVRLLKVK